MPNIWTLGQVRDTKFGAIVSNEKLLNAAEFQGYNFYCFWVIQRNQEVIKLPPSHLPPPPPSPQPTRLGLRISLRIWLGRTFSLLPREKILKILSSMIFNWYLGSVSFVSFTFQLLKDNHYANHATHQVYVTNHATY